MNWFSTIGLLLAGVALGLAIGGALGGDVDWWPIVLAVVAMACAIRGGREY